MRPQPSLPFWTRIKRAALGFDAWLNSSLFEGGRGLGDSGRAIPARRTVCACAERRASLLDLTSEAATLGVAGGVVMLGLAIPAFRETSDDWLKTQELAVTFLDRYGQEIGRRGIRHDDSYKLEEFPDYLVKAALATEDRRFYEHWGIDPIGTFRALTVNARGGGVVQGGSSITQQLAKNLFLTNERSLERKIKEAFLALWLEFHLTKDEILKLYLDRAYMGGGTHGVVAAADYYFGKSAKDLTLAESAMLAGLFKAPTKYAPHINLPAARARANDVLSNMVEAGFLTEGQIQTARRNPATPVNRSRETTPDFYLDWAFEQVKGLAADGKFGNERVLAVKTPLDTAIQRHGEQALEDMLRQYGRQYDAEQGAIVVMDVDGAVRAMVGGRDYGQSQFNRATDALRQPGSSFKPFVYAAALTDDPEAAADLDRRRRADLPRQLVPAELQPLLLGLDADGLGARPLDQLDPGAHVGRDRRDRQGASRQGRARRHHRHRPEDGPDASAAGFDLAADRRRGGDGDRHDRLLRGVRQRRQERATPYATWEVRNSQGEVIYRHDRDAPQPQVLQTQVVQDMNFMLNKVVEEGTGKRAMLDGIRAAGKTGTTNGYRDAWFVGYTGNLVAGVWFGNDDHTSTNNMTGGTLPAMAWKEVMAFAHQNLELRPIPGVPGQRAGRRLRLGPFSGDDARPCAQPPAPAVAPGTLSRRSFEVIDGIGDLFRRVERPDSGAARRAGARSRGAPGAQPSQRVAMP